MREPDLATPPDLVAPPEFTAPPQPTAPAERVTPPEPVGPAELAPLARDWFDAIARIAFVPGGRARALPILLDCLGQLAAALRARPSDDIAGYRVGAALVGANLSSPDTLGVSLTLLSQRLPADLNLDDERTRSALAVLLGRLATGFTDALRDHALTAAEGIHRAERAAWRHKQQRLQSNLQDALLHDPVTGLPNRAALTQRLAHLIADPPTGSRLGICLLNLDRFSAVYDSLGPGAGDQILLAIASRLRTLAARHGYFIAHLGGDEFALLLERTTSAEDVIKATDEALAALPEPVCLDDGHEISVSGRAGIVERSAAGTDPIELLRAAHITLGWVTRNSRSSWAVFDPRRSAADLARHALGAAMPAALRNGEFTLVYQPLVRLIDRTVVGAEALARWQHPQHGMLGPAQFIGAAEDTGLIEPLGLHLLRLACTQAAGWQRLASGPQLVSVNLAATQIRHPALPALVADVLDGAGLPAHQLQLEITENAFDDTGDATLANLHALHDLGIRLALDDFGTGYSSFAYLSELPIQAVKLATGFLRGLSRPDAPRRSNRTILPALISLCHDLGLTITAEGIETAAQAHHLTRLGCDLGQGFHLAEPTGSEEIPSLLGGIINATSESPDGQP
ncbi:MAG TPA: bifunctional diguanylate cyclase/phosphodiesterase [Rugosimonospora sp.]